MTKTEFKSQKVDDKRAALQALYEDPEGDFETMNSGQLDDFIDANWEEIDKSINPSEPEETETEEDTTENESEEVEQEPEEEEPDEEEGSDDEDEGPRQNLDLG